MKSLLSYLVCFSFSFTLAPAKTKIVLITSGRFESADHSTPFLLYIDAPGTSFCQCKYKA